MKNYFDSWGMLAQAEPSRDGGDSCQRMGMYAFGAVIRDKMFISNKNWPRHQLSFYELALSKLMNSKGNLRRHPDESMWYSDWNRASRDQTIPFICACGAGNTKGLRTYLCRYIKSHAKRLFLFTTNIVPNWVYPPQDARYIEFDWNFLKRILFFFGWRPKNEHGVKERIYGVILPDLTFLEFWGAEIRAARLWFLYPLLLVCDLEALASAVVWKYGRKNDNDCLNAVILYLHGINYYPTPIMWLACKLINWKKMIAKMYKYFDTPTSIKPMVIFYQPILEIMAIRYNDK